MKEVPSAPSQASAVNGLLANLAAVRLAVARCMYWRGPGYK